MKVRTACLGLGVLLSSAALMPAAAADWGNGGSSVKDYSGTRTAVPAVPVPAPVPLPESSGGWYIRFDAGVGVIGEPSLSESGFVYGEDDGPGPVSGPADPRTINSSWFSSDFDTFTSLGGGVGYDFGRGWRVDGTVEKRMLARVQIDGSDSWNSYEYNTSCGGCTTYGIVDGNGDGLPDRRTTISVDDKIKLDGTLWLANVYYDLFTTRGFTPYIGAGAGVMWNVISRRHQHTVSTCDLTSTPACATPVQVSTSDSGSSVDKATFAGAAMAGVSYELTDVTTLDIGYRYLFLGGTELSTDIIDSNGNVDHSRVKIGDQQVHQIRAGVRFNFN